MDFVTYKETNQKFATWVRIALVVKQILKDDITVVCKLGVLAHFSPWGVLDLGVLAHFEIYQIFMC